MNEASSLATTAVLVLGAIVLIQTLFITVANLVLQRKLRRLEPKLTRSSAKVLGLLDRGQDLLDRVEPVQGKLPVWGEIVTRRVSSFTASLAAMDDTTSRIISSVREQAREADRRTDRLLLGFSEKAAQVQRSISSPAHHLSAVVMALKAAMSRYFSSRNENTPYAFHPDQDNFI